MTGAATSSLSNPLQRPPPQSSAGTTMTGPQMPSLTIISRFNHTGIAPTPSIREPNNITARFPQVVTNAYANPDGYTVVYHYLMGSQTGIVLNLQPGIYSVSDQSSDTNANRTNTTTTTTTSSSFTQTYSGDCSNVRSIAGNIVGYGRINFGESKTCIVPYNSKK